MKVIIILQEKKIYQKVTKKVKIIQVNVKKFDTPFI